MGILRPSFNKKVQLEAIASQSDKLKIEDYAKKYSIKKIYDSYHSLLNDKNIDIVYISLPNSYHFEYAKAAIIAKKHVLCEKPITLDYYELQELEQLSKKNNTFLMEALHYHYFPPLIKLISEIKRYFGEIKKIEGFLGFPKPNQEDIRLKSALGGGAFNHMGCYLTHFITWLLPEKKWEKKNFIQKKENDVDLETHVSLTSIEKRSILYSFCVSLDHTSIDSWIRITNDEYEMLITHAFTPTTFYDVHFPGKLVLNIKTNHPAFQNIDYLKNNDHKTTYDFQLDYFLDRLNNPTASIETNNASHYLRSIILDQ
jgi:predicted dehydrogenase